MATKQRSTYQTDRPLHPGPFLEWELQARHLLQRDLAGGMGVRPREISDVVRAKRPVTAAFAAGLERALGIPAQVWLRLQATHDATVARLTEGGGPTPA